MHQAGTPTAEQLRTLTEAFQRDPGRAYAPLARALIALGRPRDAIDVASQGMRAGSESMEGRLLLGHGYYLLHQWKEAQANLLRVVKSDRNHADAFAMLGEVLLRRGDFERALPVLQHAHNLAPANPAVLAMVKRARSQQPLDPPAPIPTRLEPAGSAPRPPQPRMASDAASFDDEPTNLAPRQIIEGLAQAAAAAAPARGPAAPTMAAPQAPAPRTRAARPSAPPSPPPGSPARAQRPSAPPPAPGDTRMQGRPRVFAPDKRHDAAKESLQVSASVGEDYLNGLLMGGLLDLPNVRVAPGDYSVDAGQRWGRSLARTFVALFVLLFLAIGSAGAWYVYAEKQKAETVAQLLAKATTEGRSGSYADLQLAMEDARAALEVDKTDPYSMAVFSELTALSSYLYREVPPSKAELGIEAAERGLEGKERGRRELIVARAASTLAMLPELDSAEQRLADLRKELTGYLADHSDDTLARWLSGRAMLAAGDRKGAAAAFEQAEARGEGTVLATIDRANMLLDEGEFQRAMTIYDEVLKRSPDHPLACLGRSLARSERSTESAEAMADLNVCLAQDMGSRVGAYKQLALAYAYFFQEQYDDFGKALGTATGVQEPRFVARVALAKLLQGAIVDAGKLRTGIKWYASDPQPHPLVVLLDAELLYATGAADRAFAMVEKNPDLRAAKLRGKIYWDRAQYKEAGEEFETALAVAPADLEAQVYAAAVKTATAHGTERRAAEDDLDKLGRRAKSKLPRHIYGELLMRDGQFGRAREELEKALTDVTPEAPHPLAYRSHLALAELDARDARAAADGDPARSAASIKSALTHLNEALKQNPTNYPALDLAGRLLADRDPDKALEFLIPVVDAGVATGPGELAYARLLAGSKNETDRKRAREALDRAKTKGGVSDEELAAAAAALGD